MSKALLLPLLLPSPPKRRFIESDSKLLARLYERKQYTCIIERARTLSAVTPDIVRVALSSIRKQQQRSSALADSFHCPLLQLARGVVSRLDRQLVTAAHLCKLLEIHVSSMMPAAPLPRQIHPWLSAFTYYGVEPSVHAFAILMNAYLQSGDTEYALWIYRGMERGELTVAATGFLRAETLRMPPPNAVAVATAAAAWCRLRRWPL
ncbi:hypothetical protein IWW38_006153, partial [Coemansia aciculifera]